MRQLPLQLIGPGDGPLRIAVDADDGDITLRGKQVLLHCLEIEAQRRAAQLSHAYMDFDFVVVRQWDKIVAFHMNARETERTFGDIGDAEAS